MNELNDDLTNYYDESTFKAFKGIDDRPLSADTNGLVRSLDENEEEIISLLRDDNTHVYLAGLKNVAGVFYKKMVELFGGEEQWNEIKSRLQKEGRLSELLYE